MSAAAADATRRDAGRGRSYRASAALIAEALAAGFHDPGSGHVDAQETSPMAVAFLYEHPEMTAADARQIGIELERRLGETPPAGAVFHAEGPMGDRGWWGFDVWDTEADARRFFDEMLTPAARAAGISPPEPRMRPVAWDNRRKMKTG